jgi:hypothetical protein
MDIGHPIRQATNSVGETSTQGNAESMINSHNIEGFVATSENITENSNVEVQMEMGILMGIVILRMLCLSMMKTQMM